MTKPFDSASLLEQLIEEPGTFNFFQAMRLIELYYLKQPGLATHDFFLEKYIKFNNQINLDFKGNDIEKLLPKKSTTKNNLHFEITVNFMSFMGSQGVLPLPLTEMTLQQFRQKDRSFLDFINIFLNRTLLFFYHAWKKQHPFLFYEQSHLYKSTNLYQELLENFIGISTSSRTLDIVDYAQLFYVGRYAKRHHTASALQQILATFFEVPVKILTFQGEWLNLEDQQSTRLTHQSSNNQLGITTLLGRSVYACQHRIRIQIGPLNYARWQDFLPKNTVRIKKLLNLIHTIIEPSLNFDIQLILKKEEIPCFQLQANKHFYLGWNTWLHQDTFQHDSYDISLNSNITCQL